MPSPSSRPWSPRSTRRPTPAPAACTFTSTSWGDITSYAWSIDDAVAEADGGTFLHTFIERGKHLVSLTVGDGTSSSTATIEISCRGNPRGFRCGA